MDCLVTKLKGTVSDDSLLKIDEWAISFKQVNSSGVGTVFVTGLQTQGSAVTARIIGDAYFSNESGTENKGKTNQGNTDYAFNFYIVANGEFTLILGNKYSIKSFGRSAGYGTPRVYYPFCSHLTDKAWGFEGVKYAAQINISDFASWLKPEIFYLGGTDLKGNIEDVDLTGVDNIQVLNPKIFDSSVLKTNKDSELYGSIESILKQGVERLIFNYCGVSGDITDLVTTNLISFNLEGCKISGDITNMSFPQLKGLVLSSKEGSDLGACGYNISGNVCEAAMRTKDEGNNSLYLRGNLPNITGNIGILDDRINSILCRNINGVGTTAKLTYTKSASREKVLRLEAVTLGDSTQVDNFLQDMALLAPNNKGNSTYLIVGPSRTEASDEAVSTLQSNGYIVSIES